MEVKWFFIMCIFIFMAMCGTIAIDSMAKLQCRASALAQHAKVEDIARICK